MFYVAIGMFVVVVGVFLYAFITKRGNDHAIPHVTIHNGQKQDHDGRNLIGAVGERFGKTIYSWAFQIGGTHVIWIFTPRSEEETLEWLKEYMKSAALCSRCGAPILPFEHVSKEDGRFKHLAYPCSIYSAYYWGQADQNGHLIPKFGGLTRSEYALATENPISVDCKIPDFDVTDFVQGGYTFLS